MGVLQENGLVFEEAFVYGTKFFDIERCVIDAQGLAVIWVLIKA